MVWFKRDLRTSDHAPLAKAAAHGPVVCLYIFEPELLKSPEYAHVHHRFILESLRDLGTDLAERGGRLTVCLGEAVEVLEGLRSRLGPFTLWSHEETGNRLTYDRDLRVKDWVRSTCTCWHEEAQNGVIRPLKRRDGWAAAWRATMQRPLTTAPSALRPGPRLPSLTPGEVQALAERYQVGGAPKPEAHGGGAKLGRTCLDSFLNERGQDYRRAMSSPLHGWDGCSRLSPHLAWGTLSLREVAHASAARQWHITSALRAQGVGSRRRAPRAQTTLPLAAERAGSVSPEVERLERWQASLKSFESRLAWHCHFMQKLEDEPAIEFNNMNRAFDGLREHAFNESYFEAWCSGTTGFPMVDACMRALHLGGWINFRMRAMLASFAAYHLWLHWRRPAVFLASHFIDFEPGIHFSQFQMQSGVTGINTLRIYSPAKQVRDQDPEGVFIKRYLPELAGVPKAFIDNPSAMPPALQQRIGCVIGKDYPAPIVNAGQAAFSAQARIRAFRRRPEVRAASAQVFERHGSRRGPARGRRPKPLEPHPPQLNLDD